MSRMKKYKVLKPVMLSFLTPRDQYDATIHPDDGDYTLESDGKTIWVLIKDERHESITTANAIDIWLEQGKIISCE
jgi:hypothetical protein